MSVKIRDLIKKMLEENGWVIDERGDEFIWARGEDGHLEIYLVVDDREVTGEDVMMFFRNTEQVSGEKAIICLRGYDKSAEMIAKNMKIHLIPRDSMAPLIGEYIISLIERGEKIPLFGEEDIEVENIEFEEEEEEENEDIIPIIIEDVDSGQEKMIKVNIPEDRALAIARQSIKPFKAELHLEPYYLFEFSLKVVTEGTMEEKPVSGIIAINAVTGSYEVWRTGYETTPQIELPHVRVEPVISLDDSKKKARAGLIKEYTKEKEFTVDDKTVTIIEKRKIRPLESSIKTNYMGLYYLPVWVVEGRDGKVRINAASGEIIR